MTQFQYHLSLIAAVVFFLLMIIFNALANTLPLNGVSTGDVSYKYPNLFQPSGITFAIWGVIYLLLGAFVMYQLFQWQTDVSTFNYPIVVILILFVLSCIFNVGWLFLWHYDKILLSSIVIILLLVTLLVALYFSTNAPFLLKGSLSIYAGWVTIATIANITILLVKYGIDPFSSKAIVYTIIMLVIGALIGIFYVLIKKDYLYGAVFMWAYFGILLRHIRQENLPQSYPSITLSTLFLLIMLTLSFSYVLYHQVK